MVTGIETREHRRQMRRNMPTSDAIQFVSLLTANQQRTTSWRAHRNQIRGKSNNTIEHDLHKASTRGRKTLTTRHRPESQGNHLCNEYLGDNRPATPCESTDPHNALLACRLFEPGRKRSILRGRLQ